MNNLELTKQEINELKELIYNKIDQVSGYENLSEELKIILTKLNK
jgi:hypothetical protein